MLILNFHRVENPTGFELTRITPNRFRRCLDMIASADRDVARQGNDPLTAPSDVLITFDDAFASIGEHALPEIVRRGLTAIIFPIADAVGGGDDWDVRILGRRRRMMTWQEIRKWSEHGIAVGSHTMTHADLTALSIRALRHELVESKKRIEGETGTIVRYLSYPFGRHDVRVRDAARDAGYQACFATGASVWTDQDRFAIPRVTVGGLTSLPELQSLLNTMSGRSWRGQRKHRFFESLNAGSATIGNWRRWQHQKDIMAGRERRLSMLSNAIEIPSQVLDRSSPINAVSKMMSVTEQK